MGRDQPKIEVPKTQPVPEDDIVRPSIEYLSEFRELLPPADELGGGKTNADDAYPR